MPYSKKIYIKCFFWSATIWPYYP